MQTRLLLFVAGLFWALALISAQAGSLDFRSDGFFASPDAQVKFFREPWRYDSHLDVNGKLAVHFVSPILRPGYHNLSPDETKTEIDLARKQILDSGTISKLATACRRTCTEYQGGMLMRIAYEASNPQVTEATSRLIFPVEVFANRRARWTGGETVFPPAKPDADHFFFLNDPLGEANLFRFDLGNGTELGVKFLSPVKNVSLSDCRQWDEANYHLQASFEGQTMLVYLCLLKPQDAFPEVEAPVEHASPVAQGTKLGAMFPVGKVPYNLFVTWNGEVQVRKNGEPSFTIDPPVVQENGAWLPFAESVRLEMKGDRIEVTSKVKDKAYLAHQSFSMDGDGWLSDSITFEEPATALPTTQVALTLPAEAFAGKTLRAGERYVPLPPTPSASAVLLDDWAGKVLDFALPADGTDRVALICDQKAKTSVVDNRVYNQPSFKVVMVPRDGALQYRLHFWKDDGAAPEDTKGNLLPGASFETGPEGVRPVAGTSWNEKMVAPGVPPVFDATTAVDGTTSLRLTASDSAKLGDPRGFAFVGAVFNRIPLKRDHKYTVSAWMKADRPGLKATLYCGEDTWGGDNWDAFPVTTDWQRYHITFYTADFKKSGFFLTWAGLAPDGKEGSLWIDAVQLEEGDLSDFQPASEIEYGVEAASAEKLFANDGPCGAVLHVRNNGKTALDESVSYVLKDYWEHEVRSGVVPVKVPPETTTSWPVDFGKLPVGYYRGSFTTPGGVTKELIFGSYEPQPLTPLPDDWPLACHNDPSPLVRKLGFGAVRAFEIFDLASIAPEKGRFDFSRSDRMVDAAEKCGLTVMPVLGEFRWPSWQPDPSIPAYAQDATVENVVGGGDPVRLTWPKLDAWKDYVRALTSHYKGRITYWEVLNEPNLEMTAAQYLPYLQAAYEAAKDGNPECKLVGVCATSDSTGKPDDFTQGVLDLGGAKFFDLLSVHLYHTAAPEETLGQGSDKMIEKWRQILKDKYGKETSVWNTEKSYSSRELGYSSRKNNVPVEYCEEPQFLIDTFQHKAEYLIRETLLDAVAGGKGRFFWFGLFDDESSFINLRSFQPYGLNHTEFDQSPCPELLAANGLARVLDGRSHPFRELSWGDSTHGCVFTGDQGSVAAVWDGKRKGRLMVPVGTAPFVLRDFFGEPLTVQPNAQGEIAVETEGAPKYLSFPGRDGESSCQLLGQARVE